MFVVPNIHCSSLLAFKKESIYKLCKLAIDNLQIFINTLFLATAPQVIND